MPTSTGKPEAGPLPTKMMPLAMAGEDSNPDAKLTPVHVGLQKRLPQPWAGKAESTPMFCPGVGVNWLDVITWPCQIAGVPMAPSSPRSPDQTGLQIAAPQPPAANASSRVVPT